ncbi:MAG: formamidopyrimidine-DNA glycosylase [Ilumatobacteraceae bacterium]
MPELGDVEGFRRTVERLEGSRIDRVEVLDPGVLRNTSTQRFAAALRGRRIDDAIRKGKWLIIETDGPSVVFHFGMTGSLYVAGADQGPHRHPHDRVIFTTTSGELRYRDLRKLQGIFLAADSEDVDRIIGRIGPDALGVSSDDFRASLKSKRSTIKSALMDQTRIAGLGNMLSDEILWRSCIHPATPTGSVASDDWSRLHRAAQSTLHTVARTGHTPRGPNWLTGARWDDPAICPVCGSELKRSSIASRTSVWCPQCQQRA